MKNLWEVWSGALDHESCDNIIERAKRIPQQEATVGFDNDNRKDEKHRTSTLRWMDVQGMDADISRTLMNYIRSSNRTNFGFDIDEMNEIQFTEYHGSKESKYDWHHDVFFENTMPFDRKLSIVVQLSDPKDYVGGKFEFFGMPSPGLEFMTRGSVLVFPSFFQHRVLPVTAGTRYSLVSWIEGPKWR